MKHTVKYVFEQLWFLITLLIISTIITLCGVEQDFAGGFFPQYTVFAYYVILMGILSGFLGNLLPRRWNPEKCPFKSLQWEKEGRWYQQKLKINRWKDKVFDLSKAGVGTAEKKVKGMSETESIWLLIQETCVAELTHWALIIISPVMLLFLDGLWAAVFLTAYILMNLMDIVIQRCNRPRLLKFYHKKKSKEQKDQS